MSSMDKMWASFIAIGLMAAASFLITIARTKTKGILRIFLSIISVLLLVIMLPFALLSML